MLISERYTLQMDALQNLNHAIRGSADKEQRACHLENAELVQRQCGAIAHCLGLFGDMEIAELSQHHKTVASGMLGNGGHPWLSGLRLMRPDLF